MINKYGTSSLKVFITILLEKLLKSRLGFDQAVKIAIKKSSLSKEDRAISYRIGYETVVNFYGLKMLAKNRGFGVSAASIAEYLESIRFDFEEYRRRIIELTSDYPITLKLSLRYSYPSWLVKKLIGLIGVEETEKTLKSLNEKKRWVRVNTLTVKVEEAMKCLNDEEIEFHPHSEFEDLFKIDDPFYPIGKSNCVKKGYLIPEDIGSYIMVESIQQLVGQDLLDACSAPGVKLLHLLSRRRISSVVIVDYSLKRLLYVRSLLRYLEGGLKSIIIHGDSRIIEYGRRFSTIILDAPCSGSGAVYGDPSVKLRLSKSELERYHEIQYRLLSNALKNGYDIIYATCSIIPLEGEIVVQKLVNKYGVELVRLNYPYLDPSYPSYRVSQKTHRIRPHRVDGQGFFIAIIRGS
ncbi:MAG: RsmB/NOP family class I SAM-dependent RNA methyltransferase [Thermosphaera sp.]